MTAHISKVLLSIVSPVMHLPELLNLSVLRTADPERKVLNQQPFFLSYPYSYFHQANYPKIDLTLKGKFAVCESALEKNEVL